jgi:hypothetical protein
MMRVSAVPRMIRALLPARVARAFDLLTVTIKMMRAVFGVPTR